MTAALRTGTVRRRAAIVALVAIAGLGVDTGLLRLLVTDRAPVARRFRHLPDESWPGYAKFLDGVRARTRSGDAIAIAMPGVTWSAGYSRAYYLASYRLAGRAALPLALDDDRPRHENLALAKYVALWGPPAPSGAHVVWSHASGSLVRRP